jgi:CRP-like cAMP-binding protein
MNPDLQQLLHTVFTRKHYAKGSMIVREGQVCQYIYFIEKGLAKILSTNGDREFIMRFFPENSFVSIVDSFTDQTPSNFQFVAIEDCDVLFLHHAKYEAVCKESHQTANLFRMINQKAAANMTKRISEILINDGSQLYEKFVTENGAIVQRISLGDMAKYIGVTQVSLSRIRAHK